MSKIAPIRAILLILVIFRMRPTSKATTKPEVSKAWAAIQVLKKARKTDRHIAKAIICTTKGVQRVLSCAHALAHAQCELNSFLLYSLVECVFYCKFDGSYYDDKVIWTGLCSCTLMKRV